MGILNELITKLPLASKRSQLGPIGIDIRNNSFNMVQVTQNDGNVKPTIYRAASMTLPEGNAELLASPRLFKKTIHELLKKHAFVGTQCVTTLPASKVTLQHMFYKYQEHQTDVQSLLPQLRELLGAKFDSTVIDYIPIRPENKKQISRSAIVATTARSDIEPYLDLLNDCGMHVEALEIGPLAIKRLIAAMNPDDQQVKVLAINVGYKRSYLTVIWGRRLLLDRGINFGLQDVIDAVMSVLDIDEKFAVNLLNKYGFEQAINSEGVPPDIADEQQEMHSMLGEIVAPVLSQLAVKIRDILLYTASETRGGAVDSIYILGSISHWQGINELLEQMLSTPVHVINPFYGFGQAKDMKHIDELSGVAVATGLALRGITSSV